MNGSDDREIELEELLAAEKLDPATSPSSTRCVPTTTRRDPVPDGLVERIQFEITLDALHAEVATLTQLDWRPRARAARRQRPCGPSPSPASR